MLTKMSISFVADCFEPDFKADALSGLEKVNVFELHPVKMDNVEEVLRAVLDTLRLLRCTEQIYPDALIYEGGDLYPRYLTCLMGESAFIPMGWRWCQVHPKFFSGVAVINASMTCVLPLEQFIIEYLSGTSDTALKLEEEWQAHKNGKESILGDLCRIK